MEPQEKYKRVNIVEFENWLKELKVRSTIKFIQLHHTEEPTYSDFDGKNHSELCIDMETMHIERGFGGIAQNFTTFPDGDIVICRDLEEKTIGIKGANHFAINIENIGNFDIDNLTDAHKETIIKMIQLLCKKFAIDVNENCILYHHWFDLTTGERLLQDKQGHTKSCPGSNFFGGNTYEDFKKNLLPLLKE
ncbi:MAG TPA: N-acetylmuramoyl-L-alanine amidase [Aequorivita sp.]|nr:N-acetylmuramoyl-L-alanine amidase [Pusillimonas sp.]HAV54315.1 N-acetylmuramoyl-L-alanine amidase [Aequorivita sp.]|tara:strand:- start:20454 stop:21029 length:576 start_codon:yes stop_codon:yes gene_type:complete